MTSVTPGARDRIAMPVVLVYWLMLAGGLVVYGTTRIADFPTVIPLWIGAVAGTLLGQSLALRDFRPWIAVFVIAFAAGMGAQLLPPEMSGTQMWQAFVPAALCGFWSLGDRSALAAFWFPAVLWMLSILDRTSATLAGNGNGVVLLAGLAALFFVFLRVRESRRVGLWRAVATVPLAEGAPVELLRTPPGRQLARAGWGLSVSAITVAVTAWLAPALWQIEPLGGATTALDDGAPSDGPPCCPVDDAELESVRVREYFDLGRGHAERARRKLQTDCRVCGYGDIAAVERPPVVYRGATDRRGLGNVEPAGDVTGREGALPPFRVRGPAPSRGQVAEEVAGAPIAGAHEQPGPPDVQYVEPAHTPAPVVPPDLPAQWQPPVPQDDAHTPAPHHEAPAPAAPHHEAPAPAAPHHEAPAAPSAPRMHGTASSAGPSLLRWLLVLAAGALVFQLVALALRPLRRLVTLRHLRRPFWDETITQRVSNAWQLALVGLRDAGWRAGATEPPQELARRVEVEGVERCATILERARHGIGIDAGDLGEMHGAADTAYRAARRRMSMIARAISWLRWPLT